MINKESLATLDKIDAKKIILDELLKKFEYLRNIEKLCDETSYIVTNGTTIGNHVRIEDAEIVEKINSVLKELENKVRSEIIELERQYFELCD